MRRGGVAATVVSFVSPDLAGKRLELLRELLPGARRVLMLYGRYATGMSDEVQVSLRAAARLGLRLEALAVDSAEGLVRVFEARAQARPDEVLVIADLKMVSYRDILVEQAGRLRLPMLAGWPDLVRAGALASDSPDFAELFRRSAHHVDRILRGARPADLPVEQPTRFTLLLNLRNARALGLKVANSAVLRADEVIE